MRSFFLLMSGILLSCYSIAQTCDCKSEFLWVKAFMEKNHPGYNSDIKSPDEPAYKKFTDELMKSITADKSGNYCLVYLKRYIRFLKDHHSNISGTSLPVNETNSDSLNAFLHSPAFTYTEVIRFDSLELINRLSKVAPTSLEGVYITPDSMYTIAVMKNRNNNRDYAGIILASRTKTWIKGQVKIEIKDREDGYRDLFLFMRNHSLNYTEWLPESGNSPIPGWIKIFPALSKPLLQNISNERISFTILDSITSMISIRSFAGQFTHELDSAYKKIIPEIKKYPNLIIDVRYNGGGSDQNYQALMPLLYTDTIENDFVELFVTEDNKKAYEKMRDEAKNDPGRYGSNGYQSWQVRLNQMNNKPFNSFIPISAKNSTSTYKKESGNPLKVAILYNRWCASSCEQLVINGAFSKKVKLVGENSGGYIAYGNVMSIKTPCGNTLNWTTTRKNRDRQYEFVGITPQYKIPAGETDWVEYTRRLLQQ